ncbi:MAG: hypothetical protein WC947_03370 [Elusimicrobiota bacterium]
MAGFFIFYLFLASEIPARGLDINVDVIKLREISCGVEIDVGKAIAQRIVIRNTGETARRYKISFHKPSAIGVKYNIERYKEIPDVRWLRMESENGKELNTLNEFSIAANSEKEIIVYLKVPDKKRYYGKRYCAVMAVSEVPEEDKAAQIILAVYPRIDIETVKRADR